jgi:hypothetical protein
MKIFVKTIRVRSFLWDFLTVERVYTNKLRNVKDLQDGLPATAKAIVWKARAIGQYQLV